MPPNLFDAATTLAEVLARENDALKRVDFRGAVALGQAKEAALLAVTRDRPMAMTSDPGMVALGRRVHALVTENRMLLERAIAVQGRVLGIVLRAAAPPPAAGRYAPNGLKSQARRTTAVALSARA